MEPRARWSALAHKLIGQVAEIEASVDRALALADARTPDAFNRLHRAYSALPVRERMKYLGELDDPNNRLRRRVCVPMEHLLIPLRNQLAHGWIIDATRSEATFGGHRRGAYSERRVTDKEMAIAFQFCSSVAHHLRQFETQAGDPEVWNNVMGLGRESVD